MSSPPSSPIFLAALRVGFPPYADPLECEDLKGPRSLLGESSCLPRPIRIAQRFSGRDGTVPLLSEGAAVLWECRNQRSPVEWAGRIRVEQPAFLHRVEKHTLSVPAPTYIAGQSTSSFAVAWRLLECGALPEWGAVLCSCQSQGRGQLRRPWHSPRGNLYVTFRLPSDRVFAGSSAALVAGCILARALCALGFPIRVKWPNDLLLQETYKVGGLLLEEKDGVVLAGLGVNLTEAPAADQLRKYAATPAGVLLPCYQRKNTASFWEESEEPLAPFALWRHLVSQTILEYTSMFSGKTFADLQNPLQQLMAWQGRMVVLSEEGGITVSGCHMGAGGAGGVLLRLPGGEEREFFSGSLSLKEKTACLI